MTRLLLCISAFLFISYSAYSQKKSSPPTSKGDEFKRFEYAKNYEATGKTKKKAKKKSAINSYYDQKIVEYEERMKANVKRKQKIRKKMRKPQYSDPSYFGHKRPPKKRRPGKKKFCKVCEMVH
jgi:hypothetical protein